MSNSNPDAGQIEGPTNVVIPRQEYLSCRGCKHYEYAMRQSGRNPVYGHDCKHPKVKKDILKCVNPQGNLLSNRTPDWCPCIKKQI
jgi:hypothetical protein